MGQKREKRPLGKRGNDTDSTEGKSYDGLEKRQSMRIGDGKEKKRRSRRSETVSGNHDIKKDTALAAAREEGVGPECERRDEERGREGEGEDSRQRAAKRKSEKRRSKMLAKSNSQNNLLAMPGLSEVKVLTNGLPLFSLTSLVRLSLPSLFYVSCFFTLFLSRLFPLASLSLSLSLSVHAVDECDVAVVCGEWGGRILSIRPVPIPFHRRLRLLVFHSLCSVVSFQCVACHPRARGHG
jgi:hypothetical protein